MNQSMRPVPYRSGSVSRRAVLRALAGAVISWPGAARTNVTSKRWDPGQTVTATSQGAPFRRAGHYAAKHQQAS